MADLTLATASSHAFAFQSPENWDGFRERIRQSYAKKYGNVPPEQPQVAEESDEDLKSRFGAIDTAFRHLRESFDEVAPEILIIVGDDQNENFHVDNLPQFSIFIGDQFSYKDKHTGDAGTQESDAQFAEALATQLIERGFDIAYSREMPGGELLSHAHVPILNRLGTPGRVKVVPIFVNAIHLPGPEPSRCYDYGAAIRRAIALYPTDARVAMYASGGLSHFTAGYPWPHYSGPHSIGSISTDFDEWLLERMRQGDGEQLRDLSSADLLAHGGIEFRQWLLLLGAVGEVRPEVLAYEPFYRAVMGMGVGLWRMGSTQRESDLPVPS